MIGKERYIFEKHHDQIDSLFPFLSAGVLKKIFSTFHGCRPKKILSKRTIFSAVVLNEYNEEGC